jgi:Dyp-type peroxidase family
MSSPTTQADPLLAPGGIAENLDRIQGNIIGGFNKDFQTFFFLRFTDPGRAKKWIKSITPEVASAAEVRTFDVLFKLINSRRGGELGVLQATWMNVAFTHSGLKFIGAPQTDSFPEAFQQGMAARSAALGDVGSSAPDNWLLPLGDTSIHALMILASDDPEVLGEHVQRYLHNISTNGGVQLVYLQEGAVRQDQPGHEHFGFRDGVSQPAIRHLDQHVPGGEPIQANPGQDRLHAGEFVLGYPTQIPNPKQCLDKSGKPLLDKSGNPVTVSPNTDEGPLSPKHASGDETAPDWAVNGSYLVFRRLRQNVEAFQQHVQEQAAKLGLSEEVMGAKLVGRYKSGAPLELTEDEKDLIADGNLPEDFDPTAGDPSVRFAGVLGTHRDASGQWTNSGSIAEDDSRDNHFEYGDDPDGLIVPRGSHIRKTYPRDSATPGGGESDTQTHRIMRRGIPFGTSFRPDLGATGHGGKPGVEPPDDRGLLFLCYQSSLTRQFEFIQQNWVNFAEFPGDPDPNDPNRSTLQTADGFPDGQDPIIAQSPEGEFRLALKNGTAQQAHKLMIKHFVTTTGGEYFFQPSIPALYLLAGAQMPPTQPDAPDPDDVDRDGFDICAWALKEANDAINQAGPSKPKLSKPKS